MARVGGAAFKQVEALSLEKMTEVKIILEKESALKFQFEKVIQGFESTYRVIQDYRLRSILNNAKKDFQNQRFSFIRKLERNNQLEFKELLFHISIYSDLKLELENLKREFDLLFKKEELFQYSYLKDFFQVQYFQKGLLQSSHSLYLQNQKLKSKPPEDYRKKERQTLRALAQYFYRIGTKTSPFSHFTTLDLLSEEDGFFQNENLENRSSLFQFNNFLLVKMKALLLKEPTFFRQLKLKVNPTISIRNEEFHFIKNSKNVETIQQIEYSQILEELRSTIIPKEGITFSLVVIKLLDLVEADKESLENYLHELLELGFLEWDWGFSGLSFDWESKLQKLIFSMENFSNKTEWNICIEKMVKFKNQLDGRDHEGRYIYQKNLIHDLEKIGIENLIPELLFFEDVQISTSIQLPENEISPIIQSLDSLLRMLEPLMENEFKNRILNCWNQNFKKEVSVSLLHFYERFYQIPFDAAVANTFSKKENDILLEKIKVGIKERGKIDENGNLHFSSKDLRDIFPKENKNSLSRYSGLFQFFKNEGEVKAVINGLTPGYGKLFGRFLPLFDKEITIHLQKWNIENKVDFIWVENVDASVFNANLHPSLLEFEIRNSRSQNNLSTEKQIPINEINVTWDDKLQEPVLVYAKNDERVLTFDFGFEHPENRSPMFQLLNGFGIHHATYRYFTKLVNDLFFDENPNEIKGFRRIVIDEHLILQRQFQEVPNSFFPKKEKGESNSSNFLKIQNWKTENNIPQYIFVKPIQEAGESSSKFNRDFFKPQFIDLNSPIAIVLLQKILERHSGKIRIIEMVPNGEELISESVAEFAIQWNSGN